MSDDVDLSALRLLGKVALGLALILAAVVIAWISGIAAEWAHPVITLPPPGVSGCCAFL